MSAWSYCSASGSLGGCQPASYSCAGDALRHIDVTPTKQRHRLRVEHHHAVVPLSQLSKQLLLGGCKVTLIACIDQGKTGLLFQSALVMARTRCGLNSRCS